MNAALTVNSWTDGAAAASVAADTFATEHEGYLCMHLLTSTRTQ
jgi:hypothetical protein